MNFWSTTFAYSILMFSSMCIAAETGGVTVGGTRLIYDGGKKEAAIGVSNTDAKPYLIQSWADASEGSTEKAPFIVTPPLFRLDAHQQNTLRVVRAGGNLPEDRESLYWLNIKSIPSSDAQSSENNLQIAVKTRIKLIYRPKSLSGVPEDVTSKLSWTQSGSKLTVKNPTPFVMNFNKVTVGGHEVQDVTYVLPMSEATFAVPAGASGQVHWKLISDYGGVGSEHLSGQ